MSDEDVSVVRAAYEAYGQGEMNRLLELVHPDLEWAYLDPSMADPQPQTCHGREQLARVLGQQADRALSRRWRSLPPAGTRS
jgi:ketosteroid isomerase-like protein